MQKILLLIILLLLGIIFSKNSQYINFESLNYIGDSVGWLITILLNSTMLIFIYWLTKRDMVENDFEIKKDCFINLLSDVDDIIDIEKPSFLCKNYHKKLKNFNIKNNLNARFNYNLVKVFLNIDNKDLYRFDEDLRDIIKRITNQYHELKTYTYNLPHNNFPKEREGLNEETLKKYISFDKRIDSIDDKIHISELLSHVMAFKYNTYENIDELLTNKDFKEHYADSKVLIQYKEKNMDLMYFSDFGYYNFLRYMNDEEEVLNYSTNKMNTYQIILYSSLKKEVIAPFIDSINEFFVILDEKKKKYQI